MKVSYLWAAPEINPINRKARSIPFFNVVNIYGRVFFFSWFGFMIAFWAWYTFPPLITHTIKSDLHLQSFEVANSNIVSLVATLLVRFVSGPLCDQFGPRYVFAGLLLTGSIPLGLAPLVQNATGLYVSRFFLGILGGSFVPCMVWSTGFFDKNVVGTANALTGGFGNAGGGITYFIMPAVFDSLAGRGLTAGQAWRVTFVVPLIMVITTALGMILFCPDTPSGKWSERQLHAMENLQSHGVDKSGSGGMMVDIPGTVAEKVNTNGYSGSDNLETKEDHKKDTSTWDHEAHLSKEQMLEAATGEVVVKPTFKEGLNILFSLQTGFHVATYFCSFGGELAINSILSAYYLKNFSYIGPAAAANYAAIFGFLNFITRPLGGIISDIIFKMTNRSLWAKKFWIMVCGCMTGVLLIIIGKVDPHNPSTMFGLIALMAIFLEAGNGANFSLVPHVHPHANGIVSGITGAGGNLGGVVCAVIFRFVDSGAGYAKAFWIIGVMTIALNLALGWVKPIPKGQVGGH